MMNLKMGTIEFGMHVIDNRDGKNWVIVNKNSKAKTLILVNAENKERSFGLTTVNKNFDEVVKESETCGDGTEYAEVMQEIIAGAQAKAEEIQGALVTPEEEPPKKERKQRQKKEISEDVRGLLEFIITLWEAKGGIVKLPAKPEMSFRPLCAGTKNRQVVKLMWTTKKVSLFVRVELATVLAEKYQTINYSLPYQCMFFHDNELNREKIRDLFDFVIAEDAERKTKKNQVAKVA